MTTEAQTRVAGGQLWRQSRQPYMTRYVTLLGDGGFALLADPRQQGQTTCSLPNGKWRWTRDELEDHLGRMDYECLGQFRTLYLGDLEAVRPDR